jgi:hypothetical protein
MRPPLNHALSLFVVMCAILGIGRDGEAQESAVFLMESVERGTEFVPRPRCDPQGSHSQSFDLAVVDFADNGSVRGTKQTSELMACIQTAGKRSSSLVVMLFIHGWRHSSTWSDSHFVEFRRILQRLALREVEGRGGRRVFGIYVGWPGGSVFDAFNPSYDRAQRIGNGGDFKKLLSDVIGTTRRSNQNTTVLFTGHSLGAAILEAGFSNLLADVVGAGTSATPVQSGCASFNGLQRPELLPDLVLLLGPASEAQLTTNVINGIRGKISKRITCGSAQFEAPLVAYIASASDTATGFWFWARRGGTKTAGNVDALVTHHVTLDGSPNSTTGHSCPALRSLEDFGQSWHCLRAPQLSGSVVTQMTLDLPRVQDPRDPCHQRYVTRHNPGFVGTDVPPFWIVRVPDDIVSGHNDIFNQRSSLLAMGLLQMAGATVGIWEQYSSMFEPEQGPCTFR